MKNRIDLKQLEPDAYKIMFNFEKYLSDSGLSKLHKHIIKVRASQLNGCAYCVDMHTKEARAIGESEQRLFNLTVWRDTPFFTPEERIILAVTEEVTNISHRLSDATYEEAVRVLGEAYLAKVLMAVIVINAWNRIGVATEMAPSV